MSGLGLGETPHLVDQTLEAVKVTIIAGGAGGGPATIANGADVTQGAIADAAVTTDAAGTISAKLRGLITLFVNFLSRFPAVLGVNGGLKVEGVASGVAVPVSGTVAISQTTPGTTNKVVADVPTATPTLYNVTLTNAVTEYSQVLPANTRRVTFQCRTAFDVIYAFVTGKVATPTAPYMTLKATRAYDSGVINQGAAPSTLYLASATAGVVVEIEVWS